MAGAFQIVHRSRRLLHPAEQEHYGCNGIVLIVCVNGLKNEMFMFDINFIPATANYEHLCGAIVHMVQPWPLGRDVPP